MANHITCRCGGLTDMTKILYPICKFYHSRIVDFYRRFVTYHNRPAKEYCQRTVIVKQISAELVITAASDRNWKMPIQVPTS